LAGAGHGLHSAAAAEPVVLELELHLVSVAAGAVLSIEGLVPHGAASQGPPVCWVHSLLSIEGLGRAGPGVAHPLGEVAVEVIYTFRTVAALVAAGWLDGGGLNHI